MQTIYKIILIALSCILFSYCGNKHNNTTDSGLQDSLITKINSPELKTISKKISENVNDPNLYNERAKIYLTLGMPDEAAKDAERAIKLDSLNPNYYLTKADAFFSANKTKQSKETLELIEKKFPDNTEALLKLGELFFIVRQYQIAIDYCNKALKIDENLSKAYFIKGSIYRESGDTAKAISSLITATEQDNRYDQAFFDIGVLYAARKNPVSLDYYDNALKINPLNYDAIYAKAKFYQDINQIEEAINQYNYLLSKDKTYYAALYNLGAIQLEIKNDPKKSIDYFSDAIRLKADYLEAYFARGYAYSKVGDKESAKADYKMCLQLQENYEPAIVALNKLN
ncbi:MAG: tetratricopeptide repeat protein [Bacteroidota bacterium]